ncbi:MAG: hypothetical protein ABJH28_04235 [Paraglaciecola sp.]|uniref:hypothetical protein n=1 Tax=Paraglaciecola sp. TaxID=1920173 RepID=UPI003264FFCE
MARVKDNWWNRNKFNISGLVLLLSCYFFYQSLNPVFPDMWEAKQVGGFEISPMPYNLDPPYLHDDVYTKDFFLMFNKGQVKDIRQAYLNIGDEPLPLDELQAEGHGILHGSQHGQEVHAIAPKSFKPEHKLWLTIQNWKGEEFLTSWELQDH